jgi:hypothetical protein
LVAHVARIGAATSRSRDGETGDCQICNSLKPHLPAILRSNMLLRLVGNFAKTIRQVTEHKMTKKARCCLAFALTASCAAFALGPDRASAANECVTESNLVPPKGFRWQFHVDRATNRKCWRMVALPPPRLHRPSISFVRREAKPSEEHHFSESERAALYLEFLRWKERHSDAAGRLQ